MGFAPIVLGAVSTVAQMAGQAKQASAQRDSIRAQGAAAEQQYKLQAQRFEYAKNDAAQMYQREALVAEEMRRQAVTQFEMANVQQDVADRYSKTEEDIQDNNLKNRVSQLLATASSVRGQASTSNAGMYRQLVGSLGGNEQAANKVLQNLMAMGADSESGDAIRRQSILASISAANDTKMSADTNTRVAGYQAKAQENEAAITDRYRELTSTFLASQRDINKDFRKTVAERMPNVLDLQHQRNMLSLNTASYSRQAELSLGQESALIGRNLSRQTTQAQMSGIPSMAGSIFQGLAGIASQTVPFLLSGRGGQSQQPVGGVNGYTNQYPVLEWGQPIPSGRAPVIEWGQPLPPDRNSYQDYTGNVYG